MPINPYESPKNGGTTSDLQVRPLISVARIGLLLFIVAVILAFIVTLLGLYDQAMVEKARLHRNSQDSLLP